MEKVIIKLETLSCPSCMQKIENAVKGVDGVEKESVKVLFNSSKVKTAFDQNKTSGEAIEKVIEDLGYPVIKKTVKFA
ncbi:heavy-metal-associated domain-containing protein [Alkalibacterium olivapovliticus]|uniref:Heavy-metal-associated domain-containing protein n=1 Tax=Alkalibacterium olivapovliticus TaxID=99907 RepID=A0A2T0VVE0_9LACT|nr:cation transporter [Alkalibacterium olivapovliticus]PRY75633.1 heavy-metal-associated domain-containing protein [Alkalibacterium olivapovliticus]